MNYTKKIVLVIAVFSVLYSCSTRKNTFISRNWHTLNTKYNVLFNGNEALKQGVKAIDDNYKDDWFTQLPIEPIKFEEDKIIIPTIKSSLGAGFDDDEKKEEEKASTPFGIAEEKAVKAIQKHGMNIKDLERNRQIDDAYLLLGKARYYEQRFVPAIEAFNYVIATYPNANLIAETKIWRAKANIRNDNEEFAIESMKLLLQVRDTLELDLPVETAEQGYTALAMAYIKSDSIENAKKYLIKSTETLKNRNQGARNLFVLGQIYSSENKKDSAQLAFNKIINFKKAPYKYKMHAHIELAKNSTTDSTSAAILEKMYKLIKDRDNRPYLNELYYQVGNLHEQNDSINLAVDYYNKSLRTASDNVKQKTFTYEKLGNINFNNSKYVIASSYYDSIINIATDTLNLRFRRIKRKHRNLAALINFEETVTKNDSILKIVALTKPEQEAFFQKYIDNLKKQDEEAAQLKLNQQAFGDTFGGDLLKSKNEGKWYFYNSQSLNFGKTEFQKIWGNRALEDNWRWSAKTATNITKQDSLVVNTKNLRYNLASYLETIPSEKGKIDTLNIERNNALYELGVIYKEQFKDPKLAIERLERATTLNPEKELILPINWHLYLSYKALGDNAKANEHKNIILTDYPTTKFAQVIRNPNKPFEENVSVNEIEKKYKEFYYLYKKAKYFEVTEKIDKYLLLIPNSKLVPKFSLLKAYAIGKYRIKDEYLMALEFVAVSYGNTEEGKKAKEIIKQLNK
ncbi:tetratricopeptide repeat protein [Polaribacter sp. Z014]|uniref:type IX secretion system periplasmic lipoprotein PorW/SprE n=1 Tax=Polaribacter sp. Z014 TaxID=2927126 RepID=UPI00201FFFF7|nr:tetratricopeptide repeat protein [Polaribacter sp. Z014]